MEQKPLPLLCQYDATLGSNLCSVSEFPEIKTDIFLNPVQLAITFATTTKTSYGIYVIICAYVLLVFIAHIDKQTFFFVVVVFCAFETAHLKKFH